MSTANNPSSHEPLEDELLEELVVEGQEQIELEREILKQITPHLAYVKIRFTKKGKTLMEGPVQLVVGQVAVASIDGFDQNGNPFLGTIPTPQWSIDQSSLDSIAPDAANPNNEDVTSLAAGVANLTATVAGPNGPLTDTEQVTNVAQPQVLSSIKISFSSPVTPQAKAKK